MQFKKKINKLVCGGLVASLLSIGVAPVKAQTGNQSDTTNVGVQSDVTNIGVQSDATNLFTGDSSGSGVFQGNPPEAAPILTPLEASIEVARQIVGSRSGQLTASQARSAIQQQINALLTQSDSTSVTLSTGDTVSRAEFSTALANLLVNITPATVEELLLGASSHSDGVLVASSQSAPLLAQATTNDITFLYNTFQDAFMKAGVNRDDAQEYAQDLVVSLGNMKTWFKSNGRLNLRKVNSTTRSLRPILEALPNMGSILSGNPSVEDYSLVLMTFTGIEAVSYPLQAINDAI